MNISNCTPKKEDHSLSMLNDKKNAVVTVCMAGGVRARVPRARDEAAPGGRAAARAPAAAAARPPPRESRPRPRPDPARPHRPRRSRPETTVVPICYSPGTTLILYYLCNAHTRRKLFIGHVNFLV